MKYVVEIEEQEGLKDWHHAALIMSALRDKIPTATIKISSLEPSETVRVSAPHHVRVEVAYE